MTQSLSILKIQLRLHPREVLRPCDNKYQPVEKPPYPIYYNIRDNYRYYGRSYIAVVYQVYYTHNWAIGLGKLDPKNKNLGYHEKDIERIVVLYSKSTYQPLYIFFSAHAQEGKWYNSLDCEYENDKLVVYSSLYSHAHQPKPNIRWRIFGSSNDITSKDGPHLDMQNIEDPNIGYIPQNREVLSTGWRMFLLPLYMPIINKLKYEQKKEEQLNNRDC